MEFLIYKLLIGGFASAIYVAAIKMALHFVRSKYNKVKVDW